MSWADTPYYYEEKCGCFAGHPCELHEPDEDWGTDR